MNGTTTSWMLALALLAGCATRNQDDARARTPPPPKIESVAVVVARLSPDAAKRYADTPQFSRDELANALRRRLQGRGLVAPSSNYKIDIVVTDVHLRSGTSALVPGVPGWDDHVHGVVRVVDVNGQTLRSFEIKAAYTVFVSGRDAPRMNWLYDRFSELAAAELEKVIAPPRSAATAQR